MFVTGKILRPHGVKGEVRVFPTTDDPSRFKRLDMVRIEFEDSRESLSLHVDGARIAQKAVLVKFQGIDGMNAAERLRGGLITIQDGEALPLMADEYYVRDLYDMAVVTETGERLGIIADVLETGANDVYAVNLEKGGELLIPAVRQYIVSVDVRARIMTVQLTEGMYE